jgi:hypothetical protein
MPCIPLDVKNFISNCVQSHFCQGDEWPMKSQLNKCWFCEKWSQNKHSKMHHLVAQKGANH